MTPAVNVLCVGRVAGPRLDRHAGIVSAKYPDPLECGVKGGELLTTRAKQWMQDLREQSV